MTLCFIQLIYPGMLDCTQVPNTPRGLVIEDIVESIDLFPTLLEAAGLDPAPVCDPDQPAGGQADLCVEGKTLMPLITKDVLSGSSAEPRGEAFSQTPGAGYLQFP